MTTPISIRAINGSGPAAGSAELVERPFRDRLRQSLLIFGAGLVIGLVFLPVPLIHLFGLAAAITATVVAIRRFGVHTLVVRASGRCPSCEADTTFFMAGGLRAARWPLASSCSACGIGVRLNRA
jgi:hypothetical protein